jgi:hypothetical protein
MRKGTHHTPETRLAIRLNRLQKSMPSEEFVRFMDSDGTLKWCPACEQLLAVTEFHKNRRAWDGLYDRCKPCNAEIAAKWHQEKQQDSEYRAQKAQRQVEWRETARADGRMSVLNKKYSLKQLYGFTLEQFEAMLLAQRNCCVVCLCSFGSSKDAHVDHDHTTGIVRGLLCTNCNNGLGRFKDDPAILRRAADYLERAAWAPAGCGPRPGWPAV